MKSSFDIVPKLILFVTLRQAQDDSLGLILQRSLFKKIVVVLLFLTVFTLAKAQDTTFFYSYGTTGQDYGKDAIITYDGGLAIVGATSGNNLNNTSIYLTKLDSNCNVEWTNAIGTTVAEWGNCITQTPDSGYIIGGFRNTSTIKGYDALVVKVDKNGDHVWSKYFGANDWDFIYDVTPTNDGNYLLCGETYSYGKGKNDIYVIKIDDIGDTLWTKTYGNTGSDKAHAITSTDDGNYVLAGSTTSFGLDSSQVYFVKINNSGDTLWTKMIGSSGTEEAFDIIESQDKGLIVTGYTIRFSTKDKDVYLAKTDENGSFLWEKYFGRIGTPELNKDDEGFSVVELSNGKLLTLGYTKTFGTLGTKDIYAPHTNSNGSWIKGPVYGKYEDEAIYKVLQKNDSTIYYIGSTNSWGNGLNDQLLVKVTENLLSPEDKFTSDIDISSFTVGENNRKYSSNDNLIIHNTFNHIGFKLENKKNTDLFIYDSLGKLVLKTTFTDNYILRKNQFNSGLFYYTINHDFSTSGSFFINE